MLWLLVAGVIIAGAAWLYCQNNTCRCVEMMGGHCDFGPEPTEQSNVTRITLS